MATEGICPNQERRTEMRMTRLVAVAMALAMSAVEAAPEDESHDLVVELADQLDQLADDGRLARRGRDDGLAFLAGRE